MDGGFEHGENCRIRNAFGGFPGAVTDQIKIRSDKWKSTVSEIKDANAMDFEQARVKGGSYLELL